MFEHTIAVCDQIMKMGTPCIDLIVYKDGKCVLRSPVQQFRNKIYDAVIADLRGEELQITMPELPNDPAITY